MRVRKILIGTFLILIVMIAGGCSPKLTEDQAIKIVRTDVESDGMGEIKIISVSHRLGKYVVKWERESNCDTGTEYVNDGNGKITHGIQTIC